MWVISEKSLEFQKELLSEVGPGITIYHGAKGYGSIGLREDIEIIQIILNRIDSKKAHRVIDDIDEYAFVVEMEVNQIKGGVLRKYLLKSRNRKLPVNLHPNQ